MTEPELAHKELQPILAQLQIVLLAMQDSVLNVQQVFTEIPD